MHLKFPGDASAALEVGGIAGAALEVAVAVAALALAGAVLEVAGAALENCWCCT